MAVWLLKCEQECKKGEPTWQFFSTLEECAVYSVHVKYVNIYSIYSVIYSIYKIQNVLSLRIHPWINVPKPCSSHGPPRPTSPRCAGQRSTQLRQSYHWPIDNHLGTDALYMYIYICICIYNNSILMVIIL